MRAPWAETVGMPTNLLKSRWRLLLAAVGMMLAAVGGPRLSAATIIFDSYTPPPAFSGFSSADGGLASQIAVSQTTVISNISIYNQMLATGDVKMLIMSLAGGALLYQSAPLTFSTEAAFSWKTTPAMSFTLAAGQQYWIGYVRSVSVNDRGDTTHETMNGITSVGNTAAITGFASPAYSHVVFTGSDSPIRLSVPEPSCCLLLAGGSAVFLLRRNRRQGN